MNIKEDRPKTQSTATGRSSNAQFNNRSVFETMDNRTRYKGYYGNLERAQEDNFMHQDYLRDDIGHFADPPYVLIKPNYTP